MNPHCSRSSALPAALDVMRIWRNIVEVHKAITIVGIYLYLLHYGNHQQNRTETSGAQVRSLLPNYHGIGKEHE